LGGTLILTGETSGYRAAANVTYADVTNRAFEKERSPLTENNKKEFLKGQF
jgi:hypothetical protein